jgi:hypothetical protein
VTHFPYARAPDLSVTLSRIAVQYFTLIFHQHTEAKDVITSKKIKVLQSVKNGLRLGQILYNKPSYEQERQYMCNITLRRILATIVPVEKHYYIYSECVFVAVCFHHAMRMRHFVIGFLSGSSAFFHFIS